MLYFNNLVLPVESQLKAVSLLSNTIFFNFLDKVDGSTPSVDAVFSIEGYILSAEMRMSFQTAHDN